VDGNQVHELRQRLGLSQRALAARLGVRVATVNCWEKGIYTPNPSSVRLLEQLQAGGAMPPHWLKLAGGMLLKLPAKGKLARPKEWTEEEFNELLLAAGSNRASAVVRYLGRRLQGD